MQAALVSNIHHAMDICEYQITTGARHPWEIVRATSIRDILYQSGIQEGINNILDVGCGDGFTITEIFKTGNLSIDAVDTNLSPEQISRFSVQCRGRVNFFNSLEGLEKGHYDLITLLDVIEHTPNDRAFLNELSAYAAPGGAIFMTAPAFQWLYSSHDSFLRHYRRYNRREMEQRISETGLQLTKSGYLFTSLLLLRLLKVIFEKTLGTLTNPRPVGVAKWNHGKLLTHIIVSVLTIENRASIALKSIGISIPGLSTWALSKKSR